MRRLLYSLGQLISSFRRRLSAPPVVAIPVPFLALLAFPCLRGLTCLLVGELYELHELIGAATFTRQPYNAPVQIDR